MIKNIKKIIFNFIIIMFLVSTFFNGKVIATQEEGKFTYEDLPYNIKFEQIEGDR